MDRLLSLTNPWRLALAAGVLLALGASAFLLLPPAAPPMPQRAAIKPAKPAAKPVPIEPVVVAKPVPPAPPPKPTAFELESALSYRQLMARWDPLILEASKRFGVKAAWIRAVMQIESGGRTMLTETTPIVSRAGAMGLMQLMPETWREMRLIGHLGPDPYDPQDNILAGALYLRWLYLKYGYPNMFAAYNDGPGGLEATLRGERSLPAETSAYVIYIANILSTGHMGRRLTPADFAPGGAAAAGGGVGDVTFTRPDGAPVKIASYAVRSIREPLPGEYAPGVRAVLTIGKMHQGVRESVAEARTALRLHGARL